MDAKEKIAWVKRWLQETAAINPRGVFRIELCDVVDFEATGGIPDEAPVLLTCAEQRSIIRKLDKEGFVRNVGFDEDKQAGWIELRRTDVEDTKSDIPEPEMFTVSIGDREIWVNEFLLSKPYSVSKNLNFLAYIYQNAEEPITLSSIPPHAKEAVRGGKGSSKVLNELGFTGEILKTFFPKRGKILIHFRNNISSTKLKAEKIKIPLLMQALRMAHLKNSPK